MRYTVKVRMRQRLRDLVSLSRVVIDDGPDHRAEFLQGFEALIKRPLHFVEIVPAKLDDDIVSDRSSGP